MRILLVSHDFLPAHPAGTEIYTYQLGCELRARGHEVHIFTTEKDISRPNLRVDAREYGGLPVHELVNNLFYNDFRETWDYPPAVRSFSLFLDHLKPDAVHFMHLLYLSVGCAEETHRRRIPVFLTLHDYWLQCARFGQRIHANGTICHVIDHDRCADCLSRFKFKQTRLERRSAKLIAALRSQIGIDIGPATRRIASRLKARLQPAPKPTGERKELEPAPGSAAHTGWLDSTREMAQAVRVRDQAIRERLLPVVRRFIAPSRFLRQRFIEWGIPPERIDYMRTGIDLRPFEGFRREPGAKLRIAFIGTLAPHKGVHVLLHAWDRLPAELRARAELVLYGPKAHNPGYLRDLEILAARTGAVLAGGLTRQAVVGALAHIDLLVVPSVWYENSPLIILEALATRTPLAVSDLGGMAELVVEGQSGFQFRVGDADDLARLLASVIEAPERLAGLYEGAAAVRDVREDARDLEALYSQAIREREPRP